MKTIPEKIVDKILFKISDALKNPWWFVSFNINVMYRLFGFKNFKEWWAIRRNMYAPPSKERAELGRQLFPGISDDEDALRLSCLIQLFESVNLSLKDISSIFEVGGGYGAMARAIRATGYKGRYVIKDLPVFEKLQDYYTDVEHGILENPDLFIAWRSLSEIVPTSGRKIFEDVLEHSKYVLVSYQSEYHGVNNVDYFKSLASMITNKKWIHKGVDTPHCYLIGIPS